MSGGSITSSNKQRVWHLDQLGNWEEIFSDLSQTTSEQTRSHNDVNELDVDNVHDNTPSQAISGWAINIYDAAGNMTQLPQPASPTNAYSVKYDAWSRPDRKISETFLEFAQPLLVPLGPGATENEMNQVLQVPCVVWNAVVYESVKKDPSLS